MYLPTEREKKIISVLFTAPDMILTEEELLERSGAGKRALEGCLIMNGKMLIHKRINKLY